jgi:hypothetical protein
MRGCFTHTPIPTPAPSPPCLPGEEGKALRPFVVFPPSLGREVGRVQPCPIYKEISGCGGEIDRA